MATLKQKIEAEHRGREMLEAGEIPQPDYVEYGYTCIRFFWYESKAVLVIEIDQPPPGLGCEEVDVGVTRDEEENP